MYIDRYLCKLFNEYGRSYSLRPIAQDDKNFKPLYWCSWPSRDDNQIRKYLYDHKDDIGKSIGRDQRLIWQALNSDDPAFKNPISVDPPASQKSDTSSHWGDFMSGFFAGGMMSGGWGHTPHKW
ncbi:hypothetical protein HMPREF9103_01838 [Lentilactobacillus parafarraginis F0439]|uniref:Uncharacterized protein n=1 Tax=Lentilactobacillus parafarraginis F0439 TaxID=797515 RepID=G9ZQ33_9LACO|nr:hypothetical protein [Lentilactobacillus parafarraginis]EHL97858.1 hypothetical protein HMPREF9103_01838 [Lentilactobacillus parafarraginis F0439]